MYRSTNRNGRVDLQMVKRIGRDDALHRKRLQLEAAGLEELPKVSKLSESWRLTFDAKDKVGCRFFAKPVRHYPRALTEIAAIEALPRLPALCQAVTGGIPCRQRAHRFAGLNAIWNPEDRPDGQYGRFKAMIRASDQWHDSRTGLREPRYDFVLVNINRDPNDGGLDGFRVARLRLLLKLKGPRGKPGTDVAYVQWFDTVGSAPDRTTRMWKVKRAMRGDEPDESVILLNGIVRPVRLIPVFRPDVVADNEFDAIAEHTHFWVSKFSDSDAFKVMY